MKKFFAITLVIVMMAMATTAFATTIEEDGKGTSISVAGKYQAGSTTEEGTISVDVSWGAMDFTYTDASQGEWNPGSHSYGTGTAGSWSGNKSSITVKNHSDVAVTASFEFKATTGLNVIGTFYTQYVGNSYTAVETDKQNFSLASAVGTKRDKNDESKDETPQNTIYFAITGGSIDKSYNTEGNGLGTITVKIAKFDGAASDGFVYDVSGKDSSTLKAALSTAYQNGSRKFVLTGDPENINYIRLALDEIAEDGTIDLTLCNVTTLKATSFRSCNKLKSITLSEVTEISNNTFDGCTYLQSISAPKADSVGFQAFYSCTALTTVSLPVATTVGNNAFEGCTVLTTVSLPSCTTLGTYAFKGCSNLATVSLPLAKEIGSYTFQDCTSLVSISLPEATKIDTIAFIRCTALETVSLPKCTQVEEYAFESCTSLKSITFGTPVTTWGNDVFYDVTTLNVTLTVASGQKTFTKNAGKWNIDNSKELTAEDTTFCGDTFKEIIISSTTTENN